MEYPPFSFPELSPEEKAYIDSILHPKVKGNADGNCVVSAAKMQELHTLMGTLSSDLDRMNKLIQKMLFDAAYGKDYSGFNVVEQSRLSGKAKRNLYDIKMKFEDALGMNYTQPLNDCKNAQMETTGYIADKVATIAISLGDPYISDKESEKIPLEVLENYLRGHTNCYECTNRTEKGISDLNRVYVVLESKHISYSADLPEKIAEALLAIRDDFQCNLCIMVSNSKNKLSYRLNFTHLHGTKKAIKHYVLNTIVPLLKDKLNDIIPIVLNEDLLNGKPYLKIDTSVYNPHGRNMLMLYSSNSGEHCPMEMLVPHYIEDSLVTLIRDDSECLPEPNEFVSSVSTMQDQCEQFLRDTKEVLVVASEKLTKAAATPLPLPPISIKHANKEEEEDLYA
jgi:hypothetical protein